MFSKIFIFIKSMSLAAKIIVVTGTIAVVGGATAAVVIINQPKPEPEPEKVSAEQKPEEQKENTKKTEEDKKEKPVETPKVENTKYEPTEKKKKEEQPTPKPATPKKPEVKKTCSDLKNCDYNLNEKYVIETDTYNFYSLPEGVKSVCDEYESGKFYLEKLPVKETKTFYQIGHFTGMGGGNVPHVQPDRTLNTWKQAENYGKNKKLAAHHQGWNCGGMGDTAREWTWQETIDKGFALDEAKCKQWGLSCGRW